MKRKYLYLLSSDFYFPLIKFIPLPHHRNWPLINLQRNYIITCDKGICASLEMKGTGKESRKQAESRNTQALKEQQQSHKASKLQVLVRLKEQIQFIHLVPIARCLRYNLLVIQQTDRKLASVITKCSSSIFYTSVACVACFGYLHPLAAKHCSFRVKK